MQYNNIFSLSILNTIPDARAIIYGSSEYPNLYGIVNFYTARWETGIIIEAEISGLPNTASYSPRFLGMHLHENGDCSDNFMNTGMHYNPTGARHPYHHGDFPPLLNSNGYSFLAFYDSFLSINDVINKSVIIHSKWDDFTSQPAGDSGDKIGCGVVTRI